MVDEILLPSSFHKSLPASTLKPGSSRAREPSLQENKKISSLKYRKTFQINTPIKPQRLKRQQKLHYKRKNKTSKRAIDSNELFNSKYIPLLKSLSILFDNFLHTRSSESYEITRNKFERNYQHSEDDDVQCTCSIKPNRAFRRLTSKQTTTAPISTFTTEISNVFKAIAPTDTTTAPPYYTTNSHINGFKWNTDIPLLFTRNPTGSRRDDNGIRKGSSATNYRSVERYISRNNGDNEHNAGSAENATISQYYEEYSNSTPRNDSNSNGSIRRISRNGNNTRYSEVRGSTAQTIIFTTEKNAFEKPRGHNVTYKGENKLKARRYKTENAVSISDIDPGLRRYTIQGETHEITKPTLAYKNDEESHFNVKFNGPSNKRFLDRNGTYTTENQKVRGTDEAIMSSIQFDTTKNKMPLVMIIDGYSVARDVNGENKLNEKTIHIHS
ncbi:unnamed protein product [Parnassius apollo]|uniref:(apollo) hypothetical protein n=1 Tax=Parnassius apollo TaxID=110799 RepID=A0A8S3X1S6_PARAO|nr:unnamed protein product [Parnassius apollo]